MSKNSNSSTASTNRASHSESKLNRPSLLSLIEGRSDSASCAYDSVKTPDSDVMDTESTPEVHPSLDTATVAQASEEVSVSVALQSTPACDVLKIQKSVSDLHDIEFLARARILGISCRTPCEKCGFSLLEEERYMLLGLD
jgi:hypothetical protein